MRKAEMLSELIFNLLTILRKDGDMEIVYAIDDEGNAFNKVYHTPSIGMWDNGNFLTESDYKQMEEDNELSHNDNSVKVVCIN